MQEESIGKCYVKVAFVDLPLELAVLCDIFREMFITQRFFSIGQWKLQRVPPGLLNVFG